MAGHEGASVLGGVYARCHSLLVERRRSEGKTQMARTKKTAAYRGQRRENVDHTATTADIRVTDISGKGIQ